MQFRQATLEDIDDIIAIIQMRIDWMNEVGIHQWNDTDYLGYYNRQYFDAHATDFYVAIEDDEIVGAMALYEIDSRWPDGKRAIYQHHLATKYSGRGYAKEILLYAEEVAKERGINLMRLDSDYDNPKLEAFYTSLGYEARDSFVEGDYHGIQREKTLSW